MSHRRRASRATTALATALAAVALPAPPAAALTARAALVEEPTTQTVVYALHASARLPIASTTKLMTALLTAERLPLHRWVRAVDYHPLPAESVIHLQPGERMRVADLLRGLLLASANDAAATLAVAVAGSEERFVREMNREARRLGLRHTHYANPIGLDAAGNYSSAADLVRLAIDVRRIPFLARTVALRHATLRSDQRVRHIVNRNLLVDHYSWVDGVKTGHTIGAGYVLVGSATLHGINVVSAVLGEPSEAARDRDTLILLRHALRRFHSVLALRAGEVVARPRVAGRSGVHAELVVRRTVRIAWPRGARLRRVVYAPRQLRGPLPAGRKEGAVQLWLGRRLVARAPLYTAAAVPKPGHGHASAATVVLAGVAAAGASLLLADRRRRRGHGSPRGRRRREIEAA